MNLIIVRHSLYQLFIVRERVPQHYGKGKLAHAALETAKLPSNHAEQVICMVMFMVSLQKPGQPLW
jgi:hypothetical protein